MNLTVMVVVKTTLRTAAPRCRPISSMNLHNISTKIEAANAIRKNKLYFSMSCQQLACFHVQFSRAFGQRALLEGRTRYNPLFCDLCWVNVCETAGLEAVRNVPES